MWDIIASNQRRSVVLVAIMGVVLVLLGAAIGATVELAVRSNAASELRRHWTDRSDRNRSPERLREEQRQRDLERYLGQKTGPGQTYAERPFGAADSEPSFTDELAGSWRGVLIGMGAALAVWFVLWLTAIGAGTDILLRTAKAHEIGKGDSPQLWNVVEEMTIAAGLPKPPRIFIIDDPGLNAFAVGRRPEKAAIAITSGLLKRLSRDELQGVIAHEMGHVANLDIRFMTLAAVMVGAIVLIAEVFLRVLWYGGGGRRRSSDKGGGWAAIVMLVIAVVLAILAPVAAQLLYFACSRRREYLADASAARFTRYPQGLASALEKIGGQSGRVEMSRIVAPLCIVNPLQEGAAFKLMSTHPPTQERILILRKMGGAGFGAYEAAFQQIHGGGQRCINETDVQKSEAVAMREATAEPEELDSVERAKQVGALMDRVLALPVIACACGLRLKLPAEYKAAEVACPRCGRVHAAPRPGEGAKAQVPAGQPVEPLRYERKGTGWESVECRCGQAIQLSPKFGAPQVKCPKCGSSIRIVAAAGVKSSR